MNDLISREDALTALNGACSNWQDDSKVADIISGLPSAKVTGDLISRADAIALLTKIVFDEPPYLDSETLCRLYAEEQINTLPSAEAVEVVRDTEWVAVRRDEYEDFLASAEAEPKRVLQGYCKGADCKWWNPQVDGCNRCVMVKDEYTHPSAEAVQGWIPCSERLPDVGRDVLFSVADMYVAEGCIRADGDWTQFRWSAIQSKEEVTAWMPLPTPYKGGDSE